MKTGCERHNDCFTCPYPDCTFDETEEEFTGDGWAIAHPEAKEPKPRQRLTLGERKERGRKRDAAYRKAHIEQCREREREYQKKRRQTHKAQLAEYHRKWVKAHPEKVAEYKRREGERREEKKNCTQENETKEGL